MGREISKCLPEQKQVQRKDGYIIQGDDVVTWAFGHVLEQAQPGDYEDKWKNGMRLICLLYLMNGNY